MDTPEEASAEWLRSFFRRYRYATVDQLLEAARTDQATQAFVRWALSLRVHSHNRHTWEELDALHRSSDPRRWWHRPFIRSLWALYRNLQQMTVRLPGQTDSDQIHRLSHPQRQLLSGTGMVRRRRERMAERASRMDDDMRRDLRHCDVAIVWVDNFNKQRFATNVNEDRDLCINGAAVAVLGVQRTVERGSPADWDGWVSLGTLEDRIDTVTAFLVRVSRTFTDAVRGLMELTLAWDAVRVPCDLRRVSVTSARWWPRSILPDNVGELGPLLQTLDFVRQDTRRFRGTVGVLCDVKPYYSVLKAMYSRTHVDQNLRGELHHMPFVLGVWHAYAHAIRRVWSAFRPWWTCVEYLEVLHDLECNIYNYPKLRTQEIVVASLFLAQQQMGNALRSNAERCARDYPSDDPRAVQSRGLHLLVNEYVPALMEIGISVRELAWNLQDGPYGAQARILLARVLLMLVRLGPRVGAEYVRNLSLALLFWSRWHDSLPGHCFVEESLEASLSRLSQSMGTDVRHASVEHFAHRYQGLGLASQEAHALLKANFAEVLPERFCRRLETLMHRCRCGTAPYVPPVRAKEKYTHATAIWPQRVLQRAQRRLFQPAEAEEMHSILHQSLHRLVAPRTGKAHLIQKTRDTVQAACRHVPDLQDHIATARETASDAFLRQPRKTDQRARKRPRVQPTPSSPSSSDVGSSTPSSRPPAPQLTTSAGRPSIDPGSIRRDSAASQDPVPSQQSIDPGSIGEDAAEQEDSESSTVSSGESDDSRDVASLCGRHSASTDSEGQSSDPGVPTLWGLSSDTDPEQGPRAPDSPWSRSPGDTSGED
jgi:hypothetical protein